MWLVNFIYWMQLFLCPVILLGLAALFIQPGLITPALIMGAIIGIVLAEYVRRKIGLSVFFGRLYGSNETDKKEK